MRRSLPRAASKVDALLARDDLALRKSLCFCGYRGDATLFINEPPLIKDVFVTQQQAFSKSLGARSLRFLLGEGLLTSEEPLHRQMRRIVQPAFHHERIARYTEVMEDAASERSTLCSWGL